MGTALEKAAQRTGPSGRIMATELLTSLFDLGCIRSLFGGEAIQSVLPEGPLVEMRELYQAAEAATHKENRLCRI